MEISYLADAPEHLPVMARWLHDEWDHMYPNATLETRTKRLEAQLNRDAVPLAVVAHRGNETIGSASLIASDMDTHPELTPWLASVFVIPAFRGQGAGRRLIARIMEECGKLGFEKFYLWTDKEEQLYASMGWELEFREEYKNQLASVMSYRLKPRS